MNKDIINKINQMLVEWHKSIQKDDLLNLSNIDEWSLYWNNEYKISSLPKNNLEKIEMNEDLSFTVLWKQHEGTLTTSIHVPKSTSDFGAKRWAHFHKIYLDRKEKALKPRDKCYFCNSELHGTIVMLPIYGRTYLFCNSNCYEKQNLKEKDISKWTYQ
ncbi:MAG: hypothetical protein KFW07_03180 [Mycoplasmataceae bacterium]|nr:hypothetical protein [Mycoplasmataceae bacterium]